MDAFVLPQNPRYIIYFFHLDRQIGIYFAIYRSMYPGNFIEINYFIRRTTATKQNGNCTKEQIFIVYYHGGKVL